MEFLLLPPQLKVRKKMAKLTKKVWHITQSGTPDREIPYLDGDTLAFDYGVISIQRELEKDSGIEAFFATKVATVVLLEQPVVGH